MVPPAKPTHFTYAIIDTTDGDLQQGDIIQPSVELKSLLKDAHPHFMDKKYIAFFVLTQTCDLVRREGKPCRTKYINLAVIRPLVDILPTLLDGTCEKVEIGDQLVPGVYTSETKQKAEQRLERILNQNAQVEGVFYLHPDAGVEITEHCVALLQVSVAIRAYEHYDKLTRARSGRLNEQFQSKLGWLIGNLFSRIATQDGEREHQNRLITEFLVEKNNTLGCTFRWIPRQKARTARRQNLDITGKTIDEVADLIKEMPSHPRELAVETVLTTIKSIMPYTSGDELDTLKNRLMADAVFGTLFK